MRDYGTPRNNAEQETEWHYRYQERLGILTDGRREPTPGEKQIARREANRAVGHIGRAPLDHGRFVGARTPAPGPDRAPSATG